MSDGEIENESDTTEAEMDMSDSDAEKEEPAQIQTASNAGMIQASEALAEPSVTEETQPATACPAETSEQEDTEDFYSSDARQEVSGSAPEAQIVQADHSQPSLQANDYAPPGDIEPQSSESGSTSSGSSEWDTQLQSEEHGAGELTGVALENGGDPRTEAFEPMPDVSQPESTNQDVTDELQAGDGSSEAMDEDEDEDEYDPSDMLPHPSPSAAASDYPTPQTSSTEAMATQAAVQSVAGSQASGDSGSGSSSSTSRTPLISIIADDVASELQGQEPATTTNDQSVCRPY